MQWEVTYRRHLSLPKTFTANDTDQLCEVVQATTDQPREFEVMTDQIDVYTRRNNRRLKFMTLMAV